MDLEIDGIGTLEIGDSFKDMSPEDQNAYVDHIREQVRQGKNSGLSTMPRASESGGSMIQDVARSIRGGIPFGSRIAALAKTYEPFTGGGTYAENLAAEQAKEAELAERAPIGNLAGNLIGGAVVPLGPLARVASMPASIPAKSLLMGGTGAVFGALGGAGDARDLTNVREATEGALAGAGLGGALGGTVPVVGAGAGKVIGAVAARRAPGAAGLSPEATRILARGVKADTPEALRNEAARFGDEAMLADLGPAMLGRTQGAALASDEARAVVNNVLRARSAGASERILGAARGNLGPAVPPRVAEEGIRTARAKRDAENYGLAFGKSAFMDASPPVDTSRLVKYLDHGIPKAEGDEATALKDLRKALFKPNPDLPENMPKASDYVVRAPQEKVVSAQDYVRSLGGVSDPGGDLTSQGLNKVRGLVNPKWMHPDKVREALAEQGYFDHLYGTPERAMEESTIQDLFDAIGENAKRVSDAGIDWQRTAASEQRGGKTQRQFWDEMKGMAADATPPATVPKTEAENLHKIKGVLDDLISGQPAWSLGPGRFTRKESAVIGARGLLNDLLQTQVPGYEKANRVSEGYAKRLEALDLGGKVLGMGRDTPWPEELQSAMSRMTPKEQSALRIRARGDIEEKLRKTLNDVTASKGLVKGETDFNRANLAQIFGEEPAGRFVSRVEAENKFANTLSDVIGNSQTPQRLAGLREFKRGSIELPSSPRSGLKGAAVHVAEGLLSRLLPDRTAAAGEAARVLTKQGKERDAAINDLAAWLADQQLRRRGASAVGQRAAVGLLGRFVGSRGLLAGPQGQPVGLLGSDY